MADSFSDIIRIIAESVGQVAPMFADVGLADVGLADVGLADVGLADVGLADVGLMTNITTSQHHTPKQIKYQIFSYK